MAQEEQNFDKEKRDALSDINISLDDHWDEKVIPLCKTINEKKDFYTSSSCAGRLTLMKVPDPRIKGDKTEWIFISHDLIKLADMMTALSDIPKNHIVFRYEPFIIHVECRDLRSAERLLRLTKQLNLQNCGIVSLKEKEKDRITFELKGTANISTLIARDGKVLLGQDYLNIMTDTANMLLEGNWQLLEMVNNLIKNKL